MFWPYPTDACPKPHPWVVVSCTVRGMVLLVNVTDEENYPESPCKIAIGEHPDVIKPSVIKYPEATEMPEREMKSTISRGINVRHCADVTPALLAKILAGVRSCGDMDPVLKRKYGF